MSKKTRPVGNVRGEKLPAGTAVGRSTDARLEEFAEDLGRLLGQAQNKAESWLGQRNAIAEHLIGVRDTAARLLSQLGVPAAPAPTRARRERPAAPAPRTATSRKGSRGKKRTMSAEARAKIGAAQRARWARQKAKEK